MEGALTTAVFNYSARKSHEVAFLVTLLVMVLVIISIYFLSAISVNVDSGSQFALPEEESYPTIDRFV